MYYELIIHTTKEYAYNASLHNSSTNYLKQSEPEEHILYWLIISKLIVPDTVDEDIAKQKLTFWRWSQLYKLTRKKKFAELAGTQWADYVDPKHEWKIHMTM